MRNNSDASDRINTVNRLLSLPRTRTRNAPAACLEAAQKSLQLSEESDYPAGRAYARLSLAECALFAERDGRTPGKSGVSAASGVSVVSGGADAEIRKAKALFTQIRDAEGRMLADLLMGDFHAGRKEYAEAEAAYGAALNAVPGPGAGQAGKLYRDAAVDALCGIGAVRLAQERYGEAEAFFAEAQARCAGPQDDPKNAGISLWRARLENARSNADGARALFEKSLGLALASREFRTAAAASRDLARIHLKAGRLDDYERHMEAAAGYISDAAAEDAGNEVKSVRSYYVMENARVIANAERHLRESLFDHGARLEEANWQLNTIFKIGRTITALLDIHEVYRALFAEIRELMSLDGFFIAAYDEDSKLLEYQVLFEDGRETEFEKNENALLPAGEFAYMCIKKDGLLLINDIGQERLECEPYTPRPHGGGHGYAPAAGSAIYTCLRTKGKLIGVLCVRNNRVNAYSERQAKLLDAVSSYVSIALENAAVYQKLDDISKKVASLANHDTLTGVPNRRLLMELVPKAYANALRTNSKVAFLYMDLDRFKPINDKYGHQAGDGVLRLFSDRVQALIRSTDIFARMGGDEFVVVMTDLKISANAGTLARKIIRETSKPIVIRDCENFIGVSIGVSIYPDDCNDTNALLVMADEAMYRVKRSGRNSFAFYNELKD